MQLKHILFAGAAATGLMMTTMAGSALAAEDTYRCNGGRCYDDQADQTRALNQRALDQAQQQNDDDQYDGQGGPAYDDENDVYRDRDGDRDDSYGNDDDDDDADANPDDDRDDRRDDGRD